ncbi:hypothetical protein PoB_001334900 [Plakobranchus ocellatus]|uniref:Uncharacterized protein n=1 Tax=Plakobranchus ocellatus TaxID=259542 RepID=A0AAV3YYN1_9GAST|nr:hypothetical protein PoB_001334900 [Plakobranchus ocellatus]
MAIDIDGAEVEEANRVDKETLGSPDTGIHKVMKKKPPVKSPRNNKLPAPNRSFQRRRSQPQARMDHNKDAAATMTS